MTTVSADAPLLRHTDPVLARPLPAAVHDARTELAELVADMLAVPEAALERPWPWTGASEADVRYGLYRAFEILERAGIDAARNLAGRGGDAGLAAALVAPAGAARWDLHGLLAPLTETDIDADPGGGEWTIRLTLGHIVNSQRAYGWTTAWWQEAAFAPDDPALPTSLGDDFWADFPEKETDECAGTLADIRARLDTILDLSAERLAATPEERLAHGSRWAGFPVTVAFRFGRWSSHIREHTIQVEKTLVMLGRVPSEPERLVRLALGAYGRAESALLGQLDPTDAAEIVAAAVHEAATTVADARRAAEA